VDGNVSSPDRLGEELLTADVNGDAFADLLIGAYRADGPDNDRNTAGEAYIVSGRLLAQWLAPSTNGTSTVSDDIRIDQISLNGKQVTIEWDGAPDIRLLRTTNLWPPRWRAVAGSVGANGITEELTETSAYYRLVKK
jgi:hypothetical protein